MLDQLGSDSVLSLYPVRDLRSGSEPARRGQLDLKDTDRLEHWRNARSAAGHRMLPWPDCRLRGQHHHSHPSCPDNSCNGCQQYQEHATPCRFFLSDYMPILSAWADGHRNAIPWPDTVAGTPARCDTCGPKGMCVHILELDHVFDGVRQYNGKHANLR